MPAIRQMLVVDADADPFSNGTRNGAVFILGYDSYVLRIATAGTGLVDPVAVASGPDRKLYVVDASADPLNLGGSFGAIWIADPALNVIAPLRLAGASALFQHPTDILVEPETGMLLLSDRDADPSGWGAANGCVFRVDPATNSTSLVAAPAVFSNPTCLAYDLDGSVLVVDQTANPLGIGASAGALFRLNPWTGAVSLIRAFTRPQFSTPSAVAVIDHGPWQGDYLVVDKDADPNQRGTQPGAVFRVPKNGDPPVFFADAQAFREPIDIIQGVREDFLVMDKVAQTESSPLGTGAVFRFRLADGTLMQSPWGSNSFRSLTGFAQVLGADMDSSRVTWTDEDGGFLAPGDLMSVRVMLRNTGTHDAEVVTLSDTLRSPFNYLLGSDSVSSGAARFDETRSELTWQGSLDRGDTAMVRFRLRVGDDVQSDWHYVNRITLRAGQAPSTFLRAIRPHRDFIPGITLFSDIGRTGTADAGVLYIVGPDSLQPPQLRRGPPLQRPSDVVVLEDGRVAILDTGSTAGDLGAILYYTTSAIDTMGVIRPLRTSDGLRAPFGITIDREGNLLLVDRNANPQGWPYMPGNLSDTGPGAVYRVDVHSGELTLVAAGESWREPVDAIVDRKGVIVVVDYEGGLDRQGCLWEIREGDTSGREIELDSRLFRDPVGLCCDLFNDLYICDPTFGGGFNPNGGAVLKLRRGTPPMYSTACSSPRLRQPVDVCMASNGNLIIADRDANPSGFPSGDHGAIFEYNLVTGKLENQAAAAYMRQPDGVASVAMGDFGGSRLALAVPGVGDPRPGDTLQVTGLVINRGLTTVRSALATLSFSSNLEVVVESPPPEGMSYAPVNNQASWTGRVAYGDTAIFRLRARVLTGASFATPAEVTMSLDGGRYPTSVRQSRPIRAPFVANDVLVADAAANPSRLQDSLGAVFRVPSAAGERLGLVYSALSLQQPSALEFSATGDLLIAASRGEGPGQIYRFNTTSGGLVLLTVPGDTLLKDPSDLLLSSSGDLLVVDPAATGSTAAARGVVFRKGMGPGPLSIFSADSLFRSPRQICYGPDGHLYLADPKADPTHAGGNTGAIFVLDEDTGQVIGWKTDAAMREPVGVAPFDDSTLVVTDLYGSSNKNTLLTYRVRTGIVAPLVNADQFRSIWRTLRLSSGELLIIDREAVVPDKANSTPGLIFSYDVEDRRISYYAWSDSTTQMTDIVQKPGPVVRLDSYTAEDLSGPPVHPADRLHLRALLRNIGPAVGLGVSYVDTLPSGVSLIEESAFASSGTIDATGERLSWGGGIIPGDSVEIVYDVQLNPALAEGRVLGFVAEVTAPSVGTFQKRLDVETHVPLEPGYLYVVDADANPYNQSGHNGALYKVNLLTGSVIPMLVASAFKRPMDIALVGSQAAPKLLIFDRRARNQLQRIGTLFLFDPATRELTNLGGDATWSQATIRVLDWTEEKALVLDSAADPFNLTPAVAGPGALYSVDLVSGTIETILSDTTFKNPSAMAWLERGLLAISDVEVDPELYGDRNGAIYTLNMETRELEFFSSSPLWRTPSAIAARSGGGLLVADRESTPYDAGGGFGSVHSVAPDGRAELLTVSKFFTSLNDIESELNGNPLVSDANTDPYGFGGMPGAILRWKKSVSGKFLPLVSSKLFRDPEGFILFGGVVPVAVNEATIETTPEGISLHWRGSDDAPGARYLIYRRPASGPDDPGDADASFSELISGNADFLGAGPHEYLDTELESSQWYVYLIVGADADGSVVYSSPLLARAPELVTRLTLARPSPNPFPPGRALRFAIPGPGGRAELALFDVTGRQVRMLIDGVVTPGWHAVTWDGRDDRGFRVPSGIYFGRLSYRRDVRTTRLVLLQAAPVRRNAD